METFYFDPTQVPPARAVSQCGAPGATWILIFNFIRFSNFRSNTPFFGSLFFAFSWQVALRSLHHLAVIEHLHVRPSQVQFFYIALDAREQNGESQFYWSSSQLSHHQNIINEYLSVAGGLKSMTKWWIYFSLLGGHRKYPISAFNPQRNISQLAAPGKGIPPAKYVGSILISKGSHPNICWKNCQTVGLNLYMPLNLLVASPVIERNMIFASKKQLPNLAKVAGLINFF